MRRLTGRFWVIVLSCWLVILAAQLLRAWQADASAGGQLFPPFKDGLGTAVSDVLLWMAVQAGGAWVAWRVPLDLSRRLPRQILLLLCAAAGLVLLRLAASEVVARLTGVAAPPHGAVLLPLIAAQTRLAFVAIGSGYAIRYFVRLRESRARAASLEAQLALAELHSLRAQLHPHFLFNALNSISALLRRDPAQARDAAGRLAELFGTTLQSHRSQMTTLEEEIAFNRSYLELERLRYRERLRVTIEVPPALLQTPVPTLILQPLVENAVRHAVGRADRPVTVSIRAEAAGSRMRLVVEDDGPGLSEGWRAGVGLGNTRRRLQVHYGAAHSLEVAPREQSGAVTVLEMPLGGAR